MFTTRQLIQSALLAAAVTATAPVHADASFATGGYARIAAAHDVEGTAIPATPAFSFANGGHARFVHESLDTQVLEPQATSRSRQPSFATGGYARQVLSDAGVVASGLKVAGYPWDKDGYRSDGGFAPTETTVVAGYPWDKDGYRSDGGFAPAETVTIAAYPWDNGGYRSDGWRAPELAS